MDELACNECDATRSLIENGRSIEVRIPNPGEPLTMPLVCRACTVWVCHERMEEYGWRLDDAMYIPWTPEYLRRLERRRAASVERMRRVAEKMRKAGLALTPNGAVGLYMREYYGRRRPTS